MSTLPGRRCVGRKAGVYHGDGRAEILLLQVAVEASELAYKEHPFVDNRSAGKAGYIGITVRLLKLTSDNIEFLFKCKSAWGVCRPLHKALHDKRHAFAGNLTENFRMGWYNTPSEKW